MFRKILAGTDGSDSATLALSHAADLAERLGAELTVVTAHRADEPDDGGRGPGFTEEVIAGALLRDVEKAHGGRIAISTRSAAGAAGAVLVDLAEQEGFDLVVVGNRGISRTSLLQPASVPGRVSRRAPVAVLVVDTMGRRPPGYGRILAGTDGSATAARAVDAAAELARRLGAELTLASAASSERDGQRVLESLRARWPEVLTHVVLGEASEALADLAESQGYDLLVLGNKGMSGLRRALGSVPTRVLRRAPTNVLIIHTTG
jgi:nucleotide-binding universal stress UspA family protein